jgi:putative membrane protein
MYRTTAIAACVAAGLASAGAIAAPAAKPTDPQIAHIAYTAGQLDIEAGKQALDKSKNKMCGPSHRGWSVTIPP